MSTVKLFLASSNELEADRLSFEKEIYRKTRLWHEKGVSLQLDIWEYLLAGMSPARSQDGYKAKVHKADIFVLLAWNKVGMYTAEEFETAFGAFQKTNKPFIFTFFRENPPAEEPSLQAFKDKLATLGHFHSMYTDANDLWNRCNKELDRLLLAGFKENMFDTASAKGTRIINQDKKSAYIENEHDVTQNFIWGEILL
jgi:hypothetical protein